MNYAKELTTTENFIYSALLLFIIFALICFAFWYYAFWVLRLCIVLSIVFGFYNVLADMIENDKQRRTK